MKLNVYNGKEVVKTYEAETYEIMWGTLEDIISVIKLDDIENGTDAEFVKVVMNALASSMTMVKELFKDIFVGITDEELKHVKVIDMGLVLIEIVKYTYLQLMTGLASKN